MKAIRWILGLLWVTIFVFVVDLIFYNYVFNSMLLNSGMARTPENLRKFLPLMFAGQFLFSVFFTYYFFRIYKNAKLLILRGIFYGFWIGFFLFGWRAIWSYYLYQFHFALIFSEFALGWIECLLAGFGLGIIGWVIPRIFKNLAAQAAASEKTSKAEVLTLRPKEPSPAVPAATPVDTESDVPDMITEPPPNGDD